jgi:hypothetical protein
VHTPYTRSVRLQGLLADLLLLPLLLPLLLHLLPR